MAAHSFIVLIVAWQGHGWILHGIDNTVRLSAARSDVFYLVDEMDTLRYT